MILAIDTNIEVHEQQTAEWIKYQIATERVDSVHEAIKRLFASDKYIFVAVNEDTAPQMWDMLSTLCDSTDLPVCVITNTYTGAKKAKALSMGARSYDPFNKYDKDNVLAALEILNEKRKPVKRVNKEPPVMISGDIVLSAKRRKVFINGVQIALSKKDFDILHYFMRNIDVALSYKQIYRKIWGQWYDASGHNLVWNHVHAVRSKIEAVVGKEEYIRTEKDYGYRFLPPSDTTPNNMI